MFLKFIIILIILYICFNIYYSYYPTLIKDSPLQFMLLYAKWCGHCKAMAPEWQKLETKYASHPNVQVQKYEESEHPELMKRMQVAGFPSIYLIKDDKIIPYDLEDRSYGAFDTFINKHLQ